MAGDCSGGSLSGSTCVNTQVAVHWTDARATAAAMAYDYAPMVSGRLTQSRCRIVARFPAYEAESVCRGCSSLLTKSHGVSWSRLASAASEW